jgi:hypothetical protein
MLKSFFIALYVFGFYALATGQTADTTWFNKAWKPCEKKEAKYYRLVQQLDGLYKIRDFYLSGSLQMEAMATSMEPEMLEGYCSYYYSNGNMEATGKYTKGKKTGVWNYYSSKSELIEIYDHSFVLNKDSVRRADSIRRIKAKIPASIGDKNFSIAARGKLFAFFIIEDTYFSTATIGTELQFKGRHSLGIDYTYFGWQYEKDNTKDEGLYETYERRGYIYVDYKYRFLRYRKFDFYLNLYDKIGTYHMWYEGVAEGYNAWEKPFLSDKMDGTFNQVAAGLGFKYYLSDKFYLDVSANGGRTYSKNTSLTYDENLNLSEARYNERSEENVFYIRVNFGYKLFVKKKEPVFYTD